EQELARLDAAIAAVRAELASLGAQLPSDAPAEAQALLGVHAMILEDPLLAEQARQTVRTEAVNAEWAIARHTEQLAAQFEQLEDAYLRERGRDVQQVADRVLKALAGSQRVSAPVIDDGEPVIVVAPDIAPADM